MKKKLYYPIFVVAAAASTLFGCSKNFEADISVDENGRSCALADATSAANSSPLWGSATQYATGESPVAVIASDGLIVEVHRSLAGTQGVLVCRTGRQSFGCDVKWLQTDMTIGEGIDPFVAVNSFGYIMVVYRSTETGPYKYRAGVYQPASSTVNWSSAQTLSLGAGEEVAGVVLTPGTYASLNTTTRTHKAILLTKTEAGEIAYRRGTISSSGSVSWSGAANTGLVINGAETSVAINDNGLLALAYRSSVDNVIACRFGQYAFTNDNLSWYGNEIAVAPGSEPSVGLTRNNRFVVCYASQPMPQLDFVAGTLSINGNSVALSVENTGIYAQGTLPCVAITDKGSAIGVYSDGQTDALSYYSSYIFHDINQWMGRVANSAKLQSLSIPGTHDSGARSGFISACQDMTIMDLLGCGVRYLDIRLRFVDGRLRVYHGVMAQDLYFDEIKEACESFVSQVTSAGAPTETILFFVRHEIDNPTDAQKTEFQNAIKAAIGEGNPLWHTAMTLPANMGLARGKIILLRKFIAPNYGINMNLGGDNSTYQFNSNGNVFKIQDYYKITESELTSVKWPAVTALMDEARSNSNPNYMYINNCSSSTTLQEPWLNAWGRSKATMKSLSEYLEANVGQTQRLGTINMDFPKPQMIRAISDFNF